MRTIFRDLLLTTMVSFLGLFAASAQQQRPIVLVADTVIDGSGRVLHHTTILVEGKTIKSIGGEIPSGALVYNLGSLAVTPGLIDVHDHILWHFDNGRFAGREAGTDEPPLRAMLHGVDNAVETLNAGFTSIQSPGSPDDVYLRDAIARGIIPGPRILTSLEPIFGTNGDPQKLRELVRERKQQGADFIKLFASKSIREGVGQSMTDAQLQAACGEATKLGMRTIVHVYAPSAIKAVTLAGCTSIEHGDFATDDVLKIMAGKGTYYDPNIGLVLQNYFVNKEKFIGIGNYDEAGFASMVQDEVSTLEAFRRAIKIEGLKIIYGTDAVAGAHGHNGEEYIARVQQGGEDPMAGIISATSLSAQSLDYRTRLGPSPRGCRPTSSRWMATP